MRIKLIILFTGLFLLSINSLKSQDSVYVYDLISRADINQPVLNTVNPEATTLPIDVNLSIVFRIKNPDNASRIYIKIGNEQDSDEFLNEELRVHPGPNGYVMQSVSTKKKYKVFEDATNYFLTFPMTSSNTVKWITIYTKDKSGNISSKKFIEVQ